MDLWGIFIQSPIKGPPPPFLCPSADEIITAINIDLRFQHCYGLNPSPQNQTRPHFIYWRSNVQYLRMWLFLERGPLRGNYNLNWVGPNLIWLCTRKRTFGHTERHPDAQRKMRRRHREKIAICKPRRADSEEAHPNDFWILDFQPQNCEYIHLCCLSHRVCGILLWKS